MALNERLNTRAMSIPCILLRLLRKRTMKEGEVECLCRWLERLNAGATRDLKFKLPAIAPPLDRVCDPLF